MKRERKKKNKNSKKSIINLINNKKKFLKRKILIFRHIWVYLKHSYLVSVFYLIIRVFIKLTIL